MTPTPRTLPPTADEIRETLVDRGFPVLSCQALDGDVSRRCYYRARLTDSGSAIVAWYPTDMRSTQVRFATTTEWLQRAGVAVPRLLFQEEEAGWSLVEDAGPQTVHQVASTGATPPSSVIDGWFHAATEHLSRFATLDPESVSALNPSLDTSALEQELEQTWRTFFEPRALVPDLGLEKKLREALSWVCESIGSKDLVPCHRDYMMRNLVLRSPSSNGSSGSAGDMDEEATQSRAAAIPEIIVLDHQDLRLGPAAYDLASLLNDSLFPSARLEGELLELHCPSREQRQAYYQAAVQRTFKAVGTYSAFAQRGNDRYLPLIPETLRRGLHHLAALDETRDLAQELLRRWSAQLHPT
ncbi:MAG: phosphotransferase [Acidobacteriota bacterium]